MHLSILLECILWKIAVKFMVLTVTHAKPENQIAFVFAGSVRSFTSPQVYGSLKANLIESFCPPEHCVSDIFFRLSKTDNVHGGPYSKGQLISEEYGVISKLKIALDYLNQSAHSWNGVMKVNWVDIGSDLEHQQIVNEFKSLRHKIFRELDSRRYSMNFNRYRAYQMAIETEKKMGYRYSWVVHARLDSAWGEPLRPYHCWPSSKIWVQDTWFSPVPDTFALLPRHLSDQYYSMDLLVSEGVMCLGGPNFGEESLSDESLSKLSYTAKEKRLIRTLRCDVTHPDHDIERLENNEGKYTYSTAGFSETILERKLKKAHITREEHTLGYVQLFMTVVRALSSTVMSPICMYLDEDRMFPFLEESKVDFHPRSHAMFSGCGFMLGTASGGSPLPSTHHLSTSHVSSLDKSDTISSSSECRGIPGSDKNIWNFMPLLLKPKDGVCLTVNTTETERSLIVGAQGCVLGVWKNFMMTIYSAKQFFQFHPIHELSQTIRHVEMFEDKDDVIRCLLKRPHDDSVYFHKCDNQSQLFKVYINPITSLPSTTVGPRRPPTGFTAIVYKEISLSSKKLSQQNKRKKRHKMCLCLRSSPVADVTRVVFVRCSILPDGLVRTHDDSTCVYTVERTYTTGTDLSQRGHRARSFTHHLSPSWREVKAARARAFREYD
mmetsp:Transcript_9186/g.9256  ORF Transcript_9186/g.9256 Transcript_9186/m.9256 type:complete len:663 (-) Transcript_9186:193-2181(-)